MSTRWSILAVVMATCANNSASRGSSGTEPEPDLGAVGTHEPDVPDWKVLRDTVIPFEPPPAKDPATLPEPPTELPQSMDGPRFKLDIPRPTRALVAGRGCSSPSPTGLWCSYIKEDVSGRVKRGERAEYVEGRPTVHAFTDAQHVLQDLARCEYDSAGRVTRRELQRFMFNVPGCGTWIAIAEQQTYDEFGFLVSIEETEAQFHPTGHMSSDESRIFIYQPVYDDGGRLVARYDFYITELLEVTQEEGYIKSLEGEWVPGLVEEERMVEVRELVDIYTYEWEGDRLVRIDKFSVDEVFAPDGTWRESTIYTWAEDLVRIDVVKHDDRDLASLGTAEYVFRRLGAENYVPLFDSPYTHWEYEVTDNIETVSEFADERLVERRRFDTTGGRRRPLTVEQLRPEVLGLVLVERWDWSREDRVVVERDDGREVYLLDCANEPPIEDLLDPQCPPPWPIR